MKKCDKCGKSFSVWTRIDDKLHNLNHRRYCLECSPFGQHNTRPLDSTVPRSDKESVPLTKICARCGIEKGVGEFYRKAKSDKRHPECRQCFNRRSTELARRHKLEAVEYKGGKCMRCGYKGHIAVFDFHHPNPKEKSFAISMFKNRSFGKLKAELDKCVLLCANCHRELEALGDEADWSFLKGSS